VSLFVVVFAVYPFAAEMFRQGGIPKRLIPATIALGAFTFTMDALPGTPQIQNIIPTTFFKTNTFAAPWLGVIGAVFILITGLAYLEWRRRQATQTGEGYGTKLVNEPEPFLKEKLPNPWLAIAPLFIVGLMNKVFTLLIPHFYGTTYSAELPGLAKPVVTQVSSVAAIWAVEGALLVGILTVVLFAFKPLKERFAEGTKSAVAGALLASINTASEYGFGGVIAALPGFLVIAHGMQAVPGVLVNEAITVTALAGITGSASGGMSIALATMADSFISAANSAGVPLEALHRIAAMASGGMDTLPHNGAVITLLGVTGLTHKESYRDIFAITLVKTGAVAVAIATFYLTGIY
jgi:H+/gluconate symporter-like permease